MKKSYLILLLSLYCLPLFSQVVTANDLATLTTLADKRFSSYLSKMSFASVGRSMDDGKVLSEYFYRPKRSSKNPVIDTSMRIITGYKKDQVTGITYLTSSFTEYYSILRTFQINGYIPGGKGATAADSAKTVVEPPAVDTTPAKTPLSNVPLTNTPLTNSSSISVDSMAVIMPPSIDSIAVIDSTIFYQKGEMTVHIGEEVRDEVRMFRIVVERKPVPSSSKVRFAEDLLNFDSHQALIAMFGQNNVKRRYYYFTEQDTVRCSVIFLGTDRQAIFLWEDQENFRKLSFLIIGGTLHAGAEPEETQSVALNAWRSSSGLFTGMRLSEILRINEGDFNIYGYQSEFAMMAVPEKKGVIDFKATGAVFGCLNCHGNPTMRKEKISAQAALDARVQLHVTSIVLSPSP
jgi:hypothetical protein